MKLALALFLHLAGAWLLWSGHLDVTLLTCGLCSCLLVVALTRRLGVLDAESLPIHLLWRPFLYVPWLLREIVRSNVKVATIIWNPVLPIQPQLIRIVADQKTDVGQAFFANSITLTPGTITMDVHADRLVVHGLTDDATVALIAGEMNRRVSRLEASGDDREAPGTGEAAQ